MTKMKHTKKRQLLIYEWLATSLSAFASLYFLESFYKKLTVDYQNSGIISDIEYDQLVKELLKLDPNNEYIHTPK